MNKNRIRVYVSLIIVSGLLLALSILVSSCASQADIASRNVSKAADSFEVYRRITVINAITNDYLFIVEGLCSLGNFDSPGELSITCKVSPTEYYKHFAGLSDNVTYISEQLKPINVDPWHYRVIVNPSAVVPDIDIQTP